MRINTKCSLAIHALLMIAMIPDIKRTTSEFLASSIGCNPVEVRKILSSLKNAGIINVVRGTGGAKLIKTPKEISVLDIYKAVNPMPLEDIIGIHPNPHKECPFGRNINAILNEPYSRVANAIENEMSLITLEELCNNLKEKESLFNNQ